MKIYQRITLLSGTFVALSLLSSCSLIGQKSIVAEPTACECPDFIAPLSDTVIVVNEAKPCPVLKPVQPPKTVVASKPVANPLPVQTTDLLTVGLVENVKVVTLNTKLKAKFDTGALFTSINALDMKKFERDGKKWARFALLGADGKKVFYELPIVRTKVIKQLSGEYQERPIVILTLALGSIKEPVEATLSDRTGYVYQLLIGRNFMENRMVVDMGKTFIVK